MHRLSAFLLILLTASCSDKKNEVKPIRKDIIQAVYASGKLFPKQHYTVYSKFPGYVQRIGVNAGDAVHSGDILVTIKNETGRLNTLSARNLLDLARGNADENGAMLIAMKQEVQQAYARYRLDSLTYQRNTALQKQNAISMQAYDQSKTQFDVSAAAYLRAKENYSTTRARLNIELKNAENLFRAQESAENDYSILSVIDGKVYDVYPQTGDLVGPQTPLMEIGDSSSFEVELAVDETDISYLSIGQDISYSIDAYPDRIFKGKITSVYPKVNSASKTSRVKGSFLNDSLQLYSGMSVEANIVFREKKNALVIPRDYLLPGKKVLIKSKDEPVPVTTGAEDLEYVEIVSGISESDVLIKR